MRVFVVMISLLSVVISQKNLSTNGTASQSTTYYWVPPYNLNLTADLAISGGPTDETGGCSITWYKPFQRFAWWMLTFPVDTVYITNVKIYYRSNTLQNLAGYSLYISNSSTSKTDGHLCYHHTGPTASSAYQNVNCNHLGKNVIFYNERMNTTNSPLGKSNYAIVELAYIEVKGCYKGWWDNSCSKPCPVTCVVGHCHPGNGTCVWGCNPDNCLNDICDTATGKCTEGCKIGLSGDYCDRPCASGTFGNQCSSNCHCVNQPCDPGHGTCPAGGCQRGYKGITCSTECGPGRYGYNCNQLCDGCLSDSCDKEDGDCTDKSGCKHGRRHVQPWKCDKECVSGTFGDGCSSNCHCVNQPCDPVHGMCPDGGCQRGYNGDTCSTECSLGIYGFNCNQSCDGCLSDDCDKENGTCNDASGCKPGRQHGHPKCNKVCESRTFGNNCSENCYCVSQRQCNKATGVCPAGGCERGYKGLKCSTECGHGHYGFNCDESCDGCLFDDCDRQFGKCTNTSGCKPGRQSEQEKCDLACIDGSFGEGCAIQCHCLNGTCNKTSGICPDTRCQPGWIGEFCSKACDDEYFGDECGGQCYCKTGVCNKATGMCLDDQCQQGWMGKTCSKVKSLSDGQTTNDNTMTIVYTGVVTFIVTALMCVIIFLVILRYKLGITCRDTKKQNGQNTKGYLNDVFTNDYANIGHNNTESHYEATIPSAQEQTYDTIQQI